MEEEIGNMVEQARDMAGEEVDMTHGNEAEAEEVSMAKVAESKEVEEVENMAVVVVGMKDGMVVAEEEEEEAYIAEDMEEVKVVYIAENMEEVEDCMREQGVCDSEEVNMMAMKVVRKGRSDNVVVQETEEDKIGMVH